ncbi:MAG: hypothetical protein JM58_15690 [Peptococcaceae bacterium BICA1-8]|nr:MAG: hypothetical protein JM58_15690 [Peptococcaceae bacterium BICA1-8]
MKLSRKLSIVLIIAVLTAGILISVFSLEATKSSFNQYVFKVREAQLDQWQEVYTQYYLYQGSWQDIENLRMGGSMMRGQGQGMGWGANRQDVVLADLHGKILSHPYPDQVGKVLEDSLINKGRPIKIAGKVEGYIFPQEIFIPEARELERKFITSVLNAVVLGTLLASLIAIVFGLWLSRKMTRPLEELANVSQKVAKGDFGHFISLNTRDELGSVAQAFNKMSRELEQAQFTRKQMFADISHELRTPLTILGSRIEAALESKGILDAPQLSSLYDEVIRLQGLVKELQDLSNLEAGQIKLNIQEIDPRQFTLDLSFLFEAEANARDIKFEIFVDEKLELIQADMQKLKQIILNLLSNAFHYTQPGGFVQLRMEKIGVNAVIKVLDSGPGIDKEDLQNIFQRFYRADKSRNRATGGTGLGLAIAKGYVEAHNGQISVESIVGKGTMFIITLPLGDI